MALHSASVLLLFAMAKADKVNSRWEERVTDLERKRRGTTRRNMKDVHNKKRK